MEYGTKIKYKGKSGIWICYLSRWWNDPNDIKRCLIRLDNDLLNTTARVQNVEKDRIVIIEKECIDCERILSPDKFQHDTTVKNDLKLSDRCDSCRIDAAWNQAKTNFVHQRKMPRQD